MSKHTVKELTKRVALFYIPLCILYTILYLVTVMLFIINTREQMEAALTNNQALIQQSINERVDDLRFIYNSFETIFGNDQYAYTYKLDQIESVLLEFEKSHTDYTRLSFFNYQDELEVNIVNKGGKISVDPYEYVNNTITYELLDNKSVYLSSIEDLDKDSDISNEDTLLLSFYMKLMNNNEKIGYISMTHKINPILNLIKETDISGMDVAVFNDKLEFIDVETNKNYTIQSTYAQDMFLNEFPTDDGFDYKLEGIYCYMPVELVIKDDNFSIQQNEEWLLISYSPYIEIISSILLPFSLLALTSLLGIIILVWTKYKQENITSTSEKKIKNMAEQLSVITNTVREAILMLDEDEKVIFWNRGAVDLFGYEEDEIYGKHVLELILSEKHLYFVRREVKEVKGSSVRNIKLINNLIDATKRDGTEVKVEMMLNSIVYNGQDCIVGVFRDLTSNQSNLMQLEIFSKAIHESKDIVFITNRSGNIEFVNQTFKEITGFDESEVLGQSPSILSYFKTRRVDIKQIERTILTEGKYSEVILNRKKDGTTFYYDQTISAIYDEFGRIRYYVSTGKDITERVKSEKKMRQHMKEMEESISSRTEEFMQAKIAAEQASTAKSRFLSNMSHEIRTPLNAILGFSELLIFEENLSPNQEEYIQVINDSSKHLLSIVNDILEISKIEQDKITLNYSCVNLRKLMHSVESMFLLEASKKDLDMVTVIDDSIPELLTLDEQKMRQILINLISNAVKYTDEGSIESSFSYYDSLLMFSIRDTGVGMTDKELEYIYEPFKRNEIMVKNKPGSGLGLAICKQFISSMGGHINVESLKNVGSTFRFTIHADECKADAVESKADTNRQFIIQVKEPFEVLVVTDTEAETCRIEEILRPYNILVTKIKEISELSDEGNTISYRFVFLEFLMAEVDGLNTLEILRNILPESIVCITTKDIELSNTDIMKNKIFDEVILKPYTDIEILQIIVKYSDAEQVEVLVDSTNDVVQESMQNNMFSRSKAYEAELREPILIGDMKALIAIIEEHKSMDYEVKAWLKEKITDYDLDIIEALIQ